MPLYSYIPYLDPDIDEKEKKSFSGHFLDTDEESDAPKLEDDAAKLPNKTPVDSFKRKVNENLKNFNNKMTDLLQDGLGGVDNICKQVKGLIHHDTKQVHSEKFIEKCARGDVYDCTEEKKYNSPATDPSQDTLYFTCQENEEKIREFQRGEGSNAFTTTKEQDDIPPKRKVRSRPTSRSLRSKKSDPKCSKTKLSSKSFNATPKPSDTKKSAEKIKSKTKTKASKSRSLTQKDSKPVDEARAKKRLGQIERDYQKVVENLGMVERMMACINERVASQKLKEDLTSQETVKSEEKGLKIKKKATKPAKTKSTTQETGEESVSQTEREDERREEEKKMTKEVTRRKETNQQEKIPNKEITIEGQTDAKTNHKSDQNKTALMSESLQNPNNQNLFFQNPQKKIKLNESLTDIDALIDNAVMELGSLVYTDFDVSTSSSDASFKATNDEGAQMKYEECNSITSTSTSTDSEAVLLGEDSEKFEISRSFQELKDSYVQKIKQDTTGKTKKNKPKGKLWVKLDWITPRLDFSPEEELF
ncbi:uncharacterized protein LOC123320713 [Coccinella septempunctata]|uniref:uncharacterized protein LOC123320713 n=1 Tax=Coccinella septempunctata TaxID=41139 RepID=UPI001D07ECE7|nr:uncharacterized protein LOC123320713 [Coccinella septempunctata]